jgi:hypothetical protein
MSSDPLADPDADTFENRLENMYERYRRQSLEDDLEDLAETMEATIYQQELAEAFFEATIDIDEEAQSAVERALNALRREDYQTVQNQLDELAERITDEETRVGNEIQKLRLNRLDTVRAMRRLNERVDRVDGARLTALEQLLEDWNWRPHVMTEEAETVQDRRANAREFGDDMSGVFVQLKEELFGPYKGSDLWPLVQSLLDEERLTYGDIDDHERQLLADSDLAAYVELSLS